MNIKNATLKVAIQEADSLESQTDYDRLATCKYIPSTTRVKVSRRRKKLKEEEAEQSTKVDKHNQKRKANFTQAVKSSEMCDSKTSIDNLEKILSNSTLTLKEFIQTNFKIDSNGVLSLVATPELAEGPLMTSAHKKRTGKLPRKKVERRKETSSQQGTAPQNTKPMEKRGRKRKKTKSISPKISPTIPDYFTGSVALMHSVSDQPATGNEDQTVPSATVGDGILSAEAQALKELQEIEGMLTMFQEDIDVPKQRAVEDCVQENRKGSSDVARNEVSSEWMESVIGEIYQIEGGYVLYN